MCRRTFARPLPEGVDLADAAYTTVGAIAMQGVRQAGVSLGDYVAVIGLGLLGQLAAQMLARQAAVSRASTWISASATSL